MSSATSPTDESCGEYDAIPKELKARPQWLLWDSSADTPRRPHWNGDFGISWSDPDDWHTFEEAVEAAKSRESWGIGYVMALENDKYPRGQYGCLDLDGCLREANQEKPKEWLPEIQKFANSGAYIEYSASGEGLHIPFVGHEIPEWWADCQLGEHEGVDVLTNKFCAFTGNQLSVSGDSVTDADPTQFLFEAYQEIEGEAPRLEPSDESSDYDGDEWLGENDIQDALSHVNPDCGYDQWLKLGFAVHDWDSGSTGKRLFEQWSKGGSKYDSQAQQNIDAIWKSASEGDGVTVGTLVHHAKEAGWTAPSRPNPKGRSQQDGQATESEPSDIDVSLTPAGVVAWAGLDEDKTVDDLNDRQKAACVWALLKRSDEYHVRVRRDNGSLWTYDSGVWKPEGERTLRHAARQALDPMNYGKNVLSELKAQARSDETREVGPDKFGLESGLVAVENGVVNLERAVKGTDETACRPLEPDDYALTRLPVEYNPGAGYNEWDSYVEEWAERGRADALQEYIGYCLHIGEMPIHRALLLVGSGANGKSTFLSVVRELLGRENTSSIDLQTLANEKDAVADFYGSIANFDDDLSARKLGKGLGMFKKLVAGERVRARHLYEDGFEFQATGKHLYAANEVPDVDVPDDDEAFWRRWLLIEFPNHYPPSERDPMLENQFTTPEALSGVLNWAIEGWHRLLEQGHFTNEDKYGHEKRERWQAWGESVDKFVSECVEHDKDADNKSTGEVHRRYAAWCRENNHDPVSQRNLTNTLKKENVGYGKSVRANGTVTNGYKKLSLSDDVPDTDETPERTTPENTEQETIVD